MNKDRFIFFKNLKKIWKYVKDLKINLIWYAIVILAEAILGILIPVFSAQMILNLTSGKLEQLLYASLAVFAINIILYLMYYLAGFLFQKIYRTTMTRLQIALADETLKLEAKEIDKSSSGLFIDRLNKDTQEISSMFTDYMYMTSHVITNIGVLVAIFILNKYLFLFSSAVSLMIFFINKKRINKEYQIRKKLKKLQEKKTGLVSELVRGVRDIKLLNANSTILKQTSEKIIEASNEEIKILNIKRIYSYLENNVRNVSDLLFIIVGGYLYQQNLLTIPAFIIIYNYQGKVKNLLLGIVRMLEYSKDFIVSSDRVFEVISDERFVKEKFGSKEVKKLTGKIVFKDVSFGYEDENKIISNMSFEIKPNEIVAFVGKSGAGKTTIFNLITKLYSANSGEILFDNININELDCESVRSNVSVVAQNSYIFNFSIKDNLLLAREKATMKEIREACKTACIDDYIMSLPEKYDTLMGENGVILSGGQKQRIAIARALLKKSEIILFDEATSALDNSTQSQIQQEIKKMNGKNTILIIAHRLSTIIDCDKIFIVEDGKVIASGTHKELLKKSDYYKELYEKDLETDI